MVKRIGFNFFLVPTIVAYPDLSKPRHGSLSSAPRSRLIMTAVTRLGVLAWEGRWRHLDLRARYRPGAGVRQQ